MLVGHWRRAHILNGQLTHITIKVVARLPLRGPGSDATLMAGYIRV